MTKAPITVGIMVCTAKRPNMVCRCVVSLKAQELAPHVRAEICVVENDCQPNSRDTLLALGQEGIPLHYAQEPRQGIPLARNKTLELALEHAYDWVALIDDDEEAAPDWLQKLLDAAKDFGADVVSGPVTRNYEAPMPTWWKSLKPAADAAGTILTEAPTNNTLFSSKLISPDGAGLRFEPSLTFGFEDIDFFQRAHAMGFKIVWQPEAVVEEEIPATRVQPERLLQRVSTSAAAHVYAYKLRQGTGKAWIRFGAKALRRIMGGALLTGLSWLLSRSGKPKAINRYYKARVRLARGLGNLQGLLHILPQYYDTVDGN